MNKHWTVISNALRSVLGTIEGVHQKEFERIPLGAIWGNHPESDFSVMRVQERKVGWFQWGKEKNKRGMKKGNGCQQCAWGFLVGPWVGGRKGKKMRVQELGSGLTCQWHTNLKSEFRKSFITTIIIILLLYSCWHVLFHSLMKFSFKKIVDGKQEERYSWWSGHDVASKT